MLHQYNYPISNKYVPYTTAFLRSKYRLQVTVAYPHTLKAGNFDRKHRRIERDMTADCDSFGSCVTWSNDTWGDKWPVLAPECYLQYLPWGS